MLFSYIFLNSSSIGNIFLSPIFNLVLENNSFSIFPNCSIAGMIKPTIKSIVAHSLRSLGKVFELPELSTLVSVIFGPRSKVNILFRILWQNLKLYSVTL